MTTIGVRELRQRASEFLRRVEVGDTVEVTAHGRPVARLVPAVGASVRDLLIARGRVVAAQGDLLALGEPVPQQSGAPSASRVLAKARARER